MELGVHDVLKKTTATQSWGNFYSIPAAFSERRTVRSSTDIGATHHRYSIHVYGCSPGSYKVVNERYTERWRSVVRSRDMLRVHPYDTKEILLKKSAFQVGVHEFGGEELQGSKLSGDGGGDTLGDFRLCKVAR